MKKKRNGEASFTGLRKRAEEYLSQNPSSAKKMPVEDLQRLVQELQTHQIELEMQNEELRRTHIDLEIARDKYNDLYNFAPMGYFTVSDKGILLEANLTGSAMTGVPRKNLAGKKFSDFIFKEDLDIYYLHLEELKNSGNRKSCEVRFVPSGGARFSARFDSLAVKDDKDKTAHFRIAAVDITDTKILEREVESSRRQILEERNLLDALMQTLPVGVAIVNGNGVVVRSNRAYGEILGEPRPGTESAGDYARYTAWRADGGEPLGPGEWAAARASLYGETVIGQKVRIRRSNGSEAVIHNSAAPVRDESGNITGSAVAVQDITELMRAEERIRESERWFRTLFEGAAEGIVAAEADSGRVLFVNKSFCTMFGYGDEEMKGLSVHDLHQPESAGTAVKSFIEMSGGTLDRLEDLPCRRKDGSVFLADIRSSNLEIDGRACIVGFFTDVTERRDTEEKIRSIALFPDENPNPVFRVDRRGTLLFGNRAARDLISGWGYDTERVLPDFILSPVFSSIEGGACREIETDFGGRFYSFIVVPIKDRGYVNLYGRDITEKRAAERALQERTDRYELVVRGSGAAIWDWDVPNNRMMLSSQWKALRGHADGDPGDSGEDRLASIHPEDTPRVMEAIQAHLQGKTDMYSQVYRVRRSDGSWIWIHDRGLALRDRFGNVVRMAGMETDITGIRMEEERLAREKNDIELMNRILRCFNETEEDVLFDRALDIVREALKSEYGVFGYIAEHGHLVCPTLSRVLDECEVEGKCVHYPPEKWKGLWARALLEKRSLYVNDPPPVPAGHPVIRNNLAVPILFGSDTIGLINLANREGGYGDSEKALLEGIAERLAPLLYAWIQKKLLEGERSRSLEELRQSEERLRVATESARVGMWSVIIPSQQWEFNDQARRLFGLNESKPVDIGRLRTLTHPDDRTMFDEKNIAALGETGEHEVEYRIIRSDGRIRWLLLRGRTDPDERGIPWRNMGVVMDITERKMVGEALKETKERLEQTLESMTDGYYSLDAEWRFIALNPVAERHFGRDRSELIGRTIWELTGIGTDSILSKSFHEAEKAAVPLHFEARFGIRENFWAEMHLYPREGALEVYYTDISRRKAAEEALLDRESFYRQTLESIPGMVFTSWPDGYFDFLSQQWEDFTGVPADEHLGDGWNRFLHPDDGPRAFSAWRDAVEGRAPYNLEYRVRRHDGVYEWFKLRGTPIRGDDGNIVKWFGVAVNIEELKRIEHEREIALAELGRSEKRFAMVFQSSPAAMMIALMSDRRILEVNEAFVRLFGYGRDELLGKTSLEAGLIEVASEIAGTVEILRADGRLRNYEITIRTKDGRRRWSLVSTERIELAGEDCVIVTAIDVTERMEAEAQRETALEALKESERRVRVKLEAILSPEGDVGALDLADIIDINSIQSLMERFYAITRFPMSIIDLNGNLLVGVGWQHICTGFHRQNEESCRACVESDIQLSSGVPEGEYKLYKCSNSMWDVATPIFVGNRHIGNIFSGQFFFEDEIPDIETFREQARRFGFDEERYVRALDSVPRISRDTVDSGMSFFMEFAAMISRLSWANIKLARAITEREELMKTLQEHRADLNRAQAVSHTGSWRLDTRTNRLTWSDETYRLFGLTPGLPLTYENFLSLVHPEDREYVDREWAAAINGAPYEIEHRIVTVDGLKWVREMAEMEFADDGSILGGFGTVQDITYRRVMEDELKHINENLEQFVYVASHDLQEPLRTMASFSNLLEKKYAGSLEQEAREFLQFIVDAASRMQRLISDLLSYSRLGRLDSVDTEVDTAAVLKKVMKAMASTINENKATVKHGGLPTVKGIESAFMQIFQNLIGNAIKFRSSKKPLIIVDAKHGNGEWVFSVSDNGIGIEERHLVRIFLIFQRLHGRDKYPGTGIGLAICRKAAELHGGRIWVESAPGKGSTFYFTIPVR